MEESRWDYKPFWNETLNQVQDVVSEQEYVMWFKNIEYVGSESSKIILSAPSSFYRDQVKQRYYDLISKTLEELSGNNLSVEFVIRNNVNPEKKLSSKPVNTSKNTPSSHALKEKKTKKKHPQLREEYTFNTFVIGENSSFAANAAYAIAKNPGKAYNPCLIYGGVGLGKTHLIQSIGNSAYKDFDSINIVYIPAETFITEFTQCIRTNTQHKFKNKYRSADILLIDDIHFLQEKKGTQEELFHTFNALYDANKQMVFTCDRPVSELKELSNRLKNRFERGLNVDLQPPNYETRVAILKQKTEIKKVSISSNVIDLIARNVTTNVRDLESALTKLMAYSDLVNKPITVDVAKEQLKDVFSNYRQTNITADIIQRIVADYFGLSINDLRGRKRTKAIAFPRQVAMYIIRKITEYSTTEVGREFGGRDHTTVMHACQRVENRMRSDPTLEPTIQRLTRKVKEYGKDTK